MIFDFETNEQTLPELRVLRNMLNNEIARRELSDKAEAVAELNAIAAERGFKLSDLVGAAPIATATKDKVSPKYMDPHNNAHLWTGRGRQPEWFKNALAVGYVRESMLIRETKD